MTLLQLRYFQSVCKYGSISKASIKMHVSQPAISVAISNLEQELETMLFTRENHSLKITDAGALLLTLATDLLSSADAIHVKMREYASRTCVLRISIVPLAVSDKLQFLLNEFRIENPHIQILVYEYDVQTALRKLKSEQIDIAMVVDNGQKPDFVEGLIFSESLSTFIVGPSHPMAKEKSCTFEDLSNQSLVMTKEDSYITEKVKERFSQMGCKGNIFFYTAQPARIGLMLKSGKDGAIVSQLTADSIPDSIAIPIKEPISIRHLLLWKKSSQLSHPKELFIKKVQKVFPDTKKY